MPNDNLLGIDKDALAVSPKARALQLALNNLLDDRRSGSESDQEVYAKLALARDEQLIAIERQRDALHPSIMENLSKDMVEKNYGIAAEQLDALMKAGDSISKSALEKRAICDKIIEKRVAEIQAALPGNSKSAAWAASVTDKVVQDAYALSNQLGEEAAQSLRSAGL